MRSPSGPAIPSGVWLNSEPERRAVEILDDALRGTGMSREERDPLAEYFQRRDEICAAGIFGCTSIDRNSAARSACLEAIR